MPGEGAQLTEDEDEEELFLPIAPHKSLTTTSSPGTVTEEKKTWADIEEEIKQEQQQQEVQAAVDVIELDDEEEEEEEQTKLSIVPAQEKKAPLTLESVFEKGNDKPPVRTKDEESKAIVDYLYETKNAEANERLKRTNEEIQKRQQQRRLVDEGNEDNADENVRQVQLFLENNETKKPRRQSDPITKRSKLYKDAAATTTTTTAMYVGDDCEEEELANHASIKQTKKSYQLKLDHASPRIETPVPPPPTRIVSVPQKRKEMDAAKPVKRQSLLSFSTTAKRKDVLHDLTAEDVWPGSQRVLRSASKHFNKDKKLATAATGEVLFAYGGEFDSVSITNTDLEMCRDPKVFLNDSLIDFYIKYLVTHNGDNHTTRVHAFTSFLFSKMNPSFPNSSFATCYREVVRWTSGVNLFEKTFLLFPVNQSLHWSLAVVYLEAPTQGIILTLDSFNDESSHQPEEIARVIREYLSFEYDHRVIKGNVYEKRKQQVSAAVAVADDDAEDEVEFVRESIAPVCLDDDDNGDFAALDTPTFTVETMPLHKLRVPMQTDGVNCGLHLLHNAKVMLTVLPDQHLSTLHMQDYCNEHFSQLEFTTMDAQEMRRDICEEIESMANEYKRLQRFKRT